MFFLGTTLISALVLVFSDKLSEQKSALSSTIYQITGTQPFLVAVHLFLKGNSEQESCVVVCPCTVNEDLFSSTPNLLYQAPTRRICSSSLSNCITTGTEKSLPKH